MFVKYPYLEASKQLNISKFNFSCSTKDLNAYIKTAWYIFINLSFACSMMLLVKLNCSTFFNMKHLIITSAVTRTSKIQGIIPHSWPLQDAHHRCGNIVSQYQHIQNRMGMGTPPLYHDPNPFHQTPSTFLNPNHDLLSLQQNPDIRPLKTKSLQIYNLFEM